MQPDLTAGIVRILHADGSTAGTGFLVSADGLIATCSHVVQSERSQRDGEPRPERVNVVFEATGERRKAIVDPACWRPYDADDIAILRLDGALPAGAVPLPLSFTRHCQGHKLQTLGFPELPGGYETAWAEGEIRGVVRHPGKRPMLQLDAKPIRQGMSGAPVLNLNTQRVVGMVSEYLPNAPLEWATTSETLREICPELELRSPQAVEDYLTALAQFCDELPYVSLRSDRRLTTLYVRQQMREKPRDDRQAGGEEARQREAEMLRARPMLINLLMPINVRQWMRKKPLDDRQADEEEARQREAEMLRARPMPIEKALTQHPRLAVVGGPGAGKSALLRHLIEEQLAFIETVDRGKRCILRDSEACLPILVSLRGLVEQQGNLRTCLRKQIEVELGRRLPAPLPENFLDDWAQQIGAAWLIALDGLDEIVDTDRRIALLRELSKIPWPPDSRIVFTTRPDESVAGTKDFTSFDLLPFETEQVKEFARNWFGPDEAKVTALRQNVEALRLGDLSGTPLLLTIAVTVFEEATRRMPASEDSVLAGLRRSTLYGRFIDTLLEEDRMPNRRMRDQFIEQFGTNLGERLFRYRREALEHIALAMQEGQPVVTALTGFLRGEPLKWSASDAAKEAGAVLDVLVRQRTGLLARRGGDYEFIHPTFREYLTAAAIVHQCKADPKRVWKRAICRWKEANWREVALFALGVLSESSKDINGITALVKRIVDHSIEGLYFASHALSEGVNAADRLTTAIIDELIGLLWHDPTALARDALKILGGLGNYPRVASGMLALASDARVEETVRLEVAKILSQLGHADEAMPILLALASDARVEEIVRLEAAKTLSQLGQVDEAMPILLALAWHAPMNYFERVRVHAIEALEQLGHADEAAQAWLALARDEHVDAWGRTEAAEALGKLGRADEAVQKGLLSLACDGRVDAGVRLRAAEALGQLGRDDEAVQAWLSLARDERVNAGVHQRAAEALGKLGRADEAAPVLLALACDERVDAWVRERAVAWLVKLGRADDLLALARDEHVVASARMAAAQVLGELGRADEAARVLLILARDVPAANRMRIVAARVLGLFGLDSLLPWPPDAQKVNVTRARAIRALIDLADARILPDLERIANDDPSERVRTEAQEAIQRIRRRAR